jgi:hypothetical protein
MSWETDAIGAKQQLETARRLRELALSDTPRGQMVGNVFVAPHWTQHMANALRQIVGAKEEQDAQDKMDEVGRQQSQATIEAMNRMGVEAPESMVQAASKKPIEPGMIDRFSAFLRGDEPPSAQVQPFKQNVAQNLSPEDKEKAMLQLMQVNPEVGKPLLEHEVAKTKLAEANADRDALRQLQADKFASMYGVNPGQMGAIVGGRQILGNGQVVTLPKVGSGSSAGSVSGQSTGGHGTSSGVIGDRRDFQIMKLPNGQLARINKRTGDVLPLDAEGNTPKAASDKPMTESQANANLYSSRMDESNKILEGTNYSPAAVASTRAVEKIPGVGWAANSMLSADDQKALQAQRDFVTATLRKESGASISPSEFDNANRQYFPQVGDKPETIEQKRKNRQTAIEKMREGVTGKPAPTPSVSGFKIIGVE